MIALADQTVNDKQYQPECFHQVKRRKYYGAITIKDNRSQSAIQAKQIKLMDSSETIQRLIISHKVVQRVHDDERSGIYQCIQAWLWQPVYKAGMQQNLNYLRSTYHCKTEFETIYESESCKKSVCRFIDATDYAILYSIYIIRAKHSELNEAYEYALRCQKDQPISNPEAIRVIFGRGNIIVRGCPDLENMLFDQDKTGEEGLEYVFCEDRALSLQRPTDINIDTNENLFPYILGSVDDLEVYQKLIEHFKKVPVQPILIIFEHLPFPRINMKVIPGHIEYFKKSLPNFTVTVYDTNGLFDGNGKLPSSV